MIFGEEKERSTSALDYRSLTYGTPLKRPYRKEENRGGGGGPYWDSGSLAFYLKGHSANAMGLLKLLSQLNWAGD